MIDFSEASLSAMAVHHIGNKADEDGIIFSEREVELDMSIRHILFSYFTKPFKGQEFYSFSHTADLNLNEMYAFVSTIFNDPEGILFQSVHIAKHLYEQSGHPNIKTGELYVTYFENCKIYGEVTDAIGIFKSENKDTFLKVFPEGNGFVVNKDEGININKLDKGCLIFNLDRDKGYKMMIVDQTNRGEQALYWKEDFLKVKPVEDAYYHTRNYLQMCKDFAEETFTDAARIDQLALINESADFFKKEELFDKQHFHEKVLREPEIIDAFEDYKKDYGVKKDMIIFDEFDINSEAVRKMKRVFKSVIKLDKNFHIYVHGNRNLIRKGYDEESDMHFYQLFFTEES